MDVDSAIHSRRTVKEYEPEPLTAAELDELLELARWAPNHRLTEPWRFRVLGPGTLAELAELAGEGAAKLMRAPTLVVASAVRSPLPLHAAEDVQAAACAVYAVLLGATARGFASYWRTPAILRAGEARELLGLGEDEEVLGLIHLGRPAGPAPEAPARRSLEHYVVRTR